MLPIQVQDAAKRSNELLDSLKQPADGNTPNEAATPTDPAATPATPEVQPERRDWKAAYHVLQGKYNAEVPRLSEQLRAATGRITDLETKLATPPTPAPAAPVAPANTVELDREKYGDELVDFLQRTKAEAVESAKQAVDPLKTQVEKIEQSTEERAKAEAERQRADWMAEFTKRVPDWQAIDLEPEWQQFLATRDQNSGRQRQELLQDAFQSGDLERTVHFFNEYDKLKAPAPAAQQPPPALAARVVPDTTGRSSSGTEKKVWTRVEIKKFYDAYVARKISPEKAKEIEADIEAASREGRIV